MQPDAPKCPRSTHSIHRMITSWTEAEQFAAEHMRSLGFEDADTTSPGADGGIDVRASRAVAQVKHFADSPVGSPAVQQLAGASNRDHVSIFYSLSGFTRAAVGIAEDADVALFVYSVTGEVSPITQRAMQLLEAGFFVWKAPRPSIVTDTLVEHLSSQFQAVVDTGGLILEQASDRLPDALHGMRDDEERAAFMMKFQRALVTLRATIQAMNGQSHDLRDIVRDLTKVISIQQWLADSLGLEYAQVERRARDARSASA